METPISTAQEFAAALDLFLKAAQVKVDERFAEHATQAGKISTEEGPKYIRVVVASGMCDTPPRAGAPSRPTASSTRRRATCGSQPTTRGRSGRIRGLASTMRTMARAV